MIAASKLSQQYADVLTRLLSSSHTNEEILVKKLCIHLQAKGRLKLLPGIVRALKTNDALRTFQKPILEVAHDEESSEARSAAAKVLTSVPEAVINTSLIRGWRARVGGTLIDHSAKHKLVTLYQTITN